MALSRVLCAIAVLVASLCGACSARPADACRSICTGSAGGSKYTIRVPAHWNGTLLLYSHGFDLGVAAEHPYLSTTDASGLGRDPTSRALFGQGYALAGSAFPSAGWTIDGAVSASIALHDRFVQLIGRPRHVIVWGASMGGLITELLAERESWVDAAVPMCGVLAGTLPNLDLWTRALALVHQITGLDLNVTGHESMVGLSRLSARMSAAVFAETASANGGAPAVLAAAAALGLPQRSYDQSTATSNSRLASAAENLVRFTQLAIEVVYALDSQGDVGAGDPGLATLSLGLSAQQRGDLATLQVNDLVGLRTYLAGAGSQSANAAARNAVARIAAPSYRIRVPTITMHTEADPDVPVANETWFRDRVQAAGGSDLLRQVFIAAGSAKPHSSGVGHCSFTDAEQIALVGAADTWMTSGTAPTDAALAHDIGPHADPSFTPPAWPT